MSRALATFVLLAFLAAHAGSVGTFAGKVVHGEAEKSPPGKWLYVQARGGSLRRVEISRASFDYAASIPEAERSAAPADDLRDGALVQVTAEQDKQSREWVARSVVILRLSRDPALRSVSK